MRGTLRHVVKLIGSIYVCRCHERGDLAWAIRHAIDNQYRA